MMRIVMRTTVSIDESVLRAAKKEAAERGISLSQLVSQVLRDVVAEREKSPGQRFRMVTVGAGAEAVDHAPSELREDLDRTDVAKYRRQE